MNPRLLPLCLALMGCGYSGSARPWDPGDASPAATILRELKPVRPSDSQSCGPTAFAVVDRYYGGNAPAVPDEDGRVTALALRDFARARGYGAHVVRGELADLVDQARNGRPAIVGLLKPYGTGLQPHYEVVAGVDESQRLIATIDPARGWTVNSYEGFLSEWDPSGRVLLLVVPSPEEDAPLSARAAMNEELQHFAGGYAQAAAAAVILAFYVTLGNVVAIPLGLYHSSQRRGFMPGDSWNAPTEGERTVHRAAFIFGFPLYAFGYLFGLATIPAPVNPGPFGLSRLGITVEEVQPPESLPGRLVIVAVRGPAEKAGLEPGDVIVAAGGMSVMTSAVADFLAESKRGAALSITVLRSGIETVVDTQ